MAFFPRRTILHSTRAEWLVAQFIWLLQIIPAGNFYDRPLVVPRWYYFPSFGETGHAWAMRIFEQVQQLCYLSGRSIVLIPVGASSPTEHWLAGPAKGSIAHRAGDIDASIVYSPLLVDHPQLFIALIARNFSELLFDSANSAKSFEAEEREMLIDLTTVTLGFGIILTDARFGGGEMTAVGAAAQGVAPAPGRLAEPDLVFALALYMRAKNCDPRTAYHNLEPRLAKLLRRALLTLPARYLDGIRDVAGPLPPEWKCGESS